jgi:formate/nitrite transporter FocA (FNT family)
VANFVGAIGTAVFVALAGTLDLGRRVVGRTSFVVAAGKTAIVRYEAFSMGMLCNGLVRFAVWLTFGVRDVTGKIVPIRLPISCRSRWARLWTAASWLVSPAGPATDRAMRRNDC